MPEIALAPGEQLWFQHKRKQDGFRSVGQYGAVGRMNVMTIGDVDRHARKVVIAFPEQQMCYVVDTPQELRAVIAKLQDAYGQIVGKGQSKVISFNNQRFND